MIEEIYQRHCETYSDIYQHLPVLKRYAEGKRVVELGVRAIVSTWAFLAGNPKSLLSVDIKYPHEYGGDLTAVELLAYQAGIPFAFKLADSLEIDLPEHDVLFIDTIHEYEQLSKELARHSPKTKEYIIMHDTHLEGDIGMGKAIAEFLAANDNWKIQEDYTWNNGLTVLRRVV